MPETGRDPQVLEMTRAFFEDGMKAFRFHVEAMFPVVGGVRVPIGHEQLSEEEEWDLLEEVWRKWTRWQAGEAEEDSDILAFDRNDGQPQERLAELRLKYSDGGNGEVKT